jgi:cytoskeletal protein RodZ
VETINNDFRKPFEGVVMKPAGETQSPETTESPGKYLKAKRESQRISLREVADATRIREAVLRAIEEDRYEDLPHLYVKSFLSAYAKYVGLDPTDVIILHQKPVENLSLLKGRVLKYQSVPRKKGVNVRLLVISISVALLIALIVYISLKLLN